MNITTVATLSKSLSVKREKCDDDGERVIGHMKIAYAVISREEIDGILGIRIQPGVPWARNCLFDELGAPLARLELSAPRRELTASVRFRGTGQEEMHIAGGTLKAISLTLDQSGALLSGELTWEVAGDEISDAEPLLGQIVAAEMSLTDGEQGDLLRAAA